MAKLLSLLCGISAPTGKVYALIARCVNDFCGAARQVLPLAQDSKMKQKKLCYNCRAAKEPCGAGRLRRREKKRPLHKGTVKRGKKRLPPEEKRAMIRWKSRKGAQF